MELDTHTEFQHTYKGSKPATTIGAMSPPSGSSIPTRVRNSDSSRASNMPSDGFQHTYKGSKPVLGRTIEKILNSSSIPTRVRNSCIALIISFLSFVPAYLQGFETI